MILTLESKAKFGGLGIFRLDEWIAHRERGASAWGACHSSARTGIFKVMAKIYHIANIVCDKPHRAKRACDGSIVDNAIFIK